jgi:hypothetical protein
MPLLDELMQMGITENQITQDADFIKRYVEQKQAQGENLGPQPYGQLYGGSYMPSSNPDYNTGANTWAAVRSGVYEME